MVMNVINAVLTFTTWVVICALIVVLYRIGRFYQISSGRRSYYQYFSIPLVLFALGVLTSLFLRELQFWGDLLLLAGGAALIGLCFYLLRLMTGNRP